MFSRVYRNDAWLSGKDEWAHLGSNQTPPLAALVDHAPLTAFFAAGSRLSQAVSGVGSSTLARSRGGRQVVKAARPFTLEGRQP